MHTVAGSIPGVAPFLGRVAQLVEATGLGPVRWGFESLRDYSTVGQPSTYETRRWVPRDQSLSAQARHSRWP